ncbi:uncharacterized protein LOC114519859 [Dendronephthya gigantea]|uniref:uncharacterized protein LOC114519859 n=1 Tax=Dendronephthya gigantea TaxID=151771 RepID=UPI00106C8884|nr:uncharacterized protein LOC114519859 [Dendronephthya gigantea]XP_028395843.1 uncharacterized protein LOC114519859 [Dendronephthya gigantea]
MEQRVRVAEVQTVRSKLFRVVIAVADIFRGKERTQDLSADFCSHLEFFDYVGFFKKSCFSEVKVIKDMQDRKVRLKGHGDKFFSACNKCKGVERTLRQNEHVLNDERKWNIVVKNEEFVRGIMNKSKIMAKVDPDESGKSVNIMATDGVHWKRAEKALTESIVVKEVKIPKNADIDFDGEDFEDFRSELENNRIVVLDHKRSWMGILKLIGAKEDVRKATILTKQFLASKQRNDLWHVNNNDFSTRKEQPLEDDRMWEFVANNEKYVEEIMTSREITAKVELHGSGKSVFITAKDDVHWLRAQKALAESIIIERVLIPQDAGIDIDSEDFQTFRSNQENDQIIKIYFVTLDDSSQVIDIIGANESVTTAKFAAKKFIASKERNEQDRSAGISTIDLPLTWDEQAKGKVAQLVDVLPSSNEYQEIFQLFNDSIEGGYSVTKIERIQNPALYRAYMVKKQSMMGGENEKRLFHGTDVKNVEAINVNNFSRSYSGINGHTYGNGVYFARDSAYSLRFCDSSDSQDAQMYIVKVLVGKYSLGKKDMNAPPSRNDPHNPGLNFDSLVNDTTDPTIFVIFQDHQCYPEYLISFKKRTRTWSLKNLFRKNKN